MNRSLINIRRMHRGRDVLQLKDEEQWVIATFAKRDGLLLPFTETKLMGKKVEIFLLKDGVKVQLDDGNLRISDMNSLHKEVEGWVDEGGSVYFEIANIFLGSHGSRSMLADKGAGV